MASKEELLKAVTEGITIRQISDLEYEREWKRERALRHVILRYLTEHGPTRWDDLFEHFPQYAPGKVASALRHLARSMHIVIEDGDIVKISALGTARLN